MNRRSLPMAALLLMIGLLPIGCGIDSEVETTYGRSRGKSINGTGVFAQILRNQGHEVRAAIRATDTLADWADVLVRFGPRPGPPDREEGEWLLRWLEAEPGREIVYIPQDFDAEPEFWEAMLAAQPKGSAPEILKRIERKRDLSRNWAADLPPQAKTPANSTEWFAVGPKPANPSTCKVLGGPWSDEVDQARAAISKHQVLKVEGDEIVLLDGDGSPLALSWTIDNGSRVLVVANASFLLNASLLNRARRPLAMQVADWIGPGAKHVAFFEGRRVVPAEAESSMASPFWLFQVEPFSWIGVHMLIFLVILALSFAVRLGRPRPEAPSGVERPSAHPEALGALLAKTGRGDAALFLLEFYRRWRHPSHVAGRTAPAPPTSR